MKTPSKITMKVEELPSGNYRVRKMINGHNIQVVFDHAPGQKEILDALHDFSDDTPVKGSFQTYAEKYIQTKSNVLSPATVRGYQSILKNLPESFTRKKLSQLTQADIQAMINEYSVDRSAKSTINAHGFVVGVILLYRPSMRINTKLPQKAPKKTYVPTEEDIKKILERAKGTQYHVPFMLGTMSLRLSEVCALTLDDIDVENNTLSINKALVKGKDNKYVLKTTKTEAGTRDIFIPSSLIDEIMEQGKIYDGYPNNCLKALHRYQDELGIPQFRFHDLRHFFASYSHLQGMPEAAILSTGGWKSDHVMKSVYRHEMEQKQAQEEVFGKLFS